MSPALYTKLFTASPISYVDNVRAKVLLHMGEVDLRVAPTNTLTFYHALKGRGKTVELFTFPKDSHPLEGVKTSRICWESTRDWFESEWSVYAMGSIRYATYITVKNNEVK